MTNEQFWSYVDASGDCWLWAGNLTKLGYGHLNLDGKTKLAHRASYELLCGPIPEGLTLDHLCRVRHCVNPDHLEPVTSAENVLRGYSLAAQNARKTECPKGHPFSSENTGYVTYQGARSRYCRTCNQQDCQERYVSHPRILKTHCLRGHEYTPENTYALVNQRGTKRECLICRRTRKRDKRMLRRSMGNVT